MEEDLIWEKMKNATKYVVQKRTGDLSFFAYNKAVFWSIWKQIKRYWTIKSEKS